MQIVYGFSKWAEFLWLHSYTLLNLTSLHPTSTMLYKFHICDIRTIWQGSLCITLQVALRQIQELKPHLEQKKKYTAVCCKNAMNYPSKKCVEEKKKPFNIILWSNVLQPLIDTFMPNSKKTLVLYWKHLCFFKWKTNFLVFSRA